MKAEKIEMILDKDVAYFSIKFEGLPCCMMVPVDEGLRLALQIIEAYSRSFHFAPVKVKKKVGRPRKK